MKPILFDFFAFPLPAWHFFFSLGVICSFLCFLFLSRRSRCFEGDSLFPYFLFCMIYSAGYFGARALSEGRSGSPQLTLGGEMTFYGGVIGGFFALFFSDALLRLASVFHYFQIQPHTVRNKRSSFLSWKFIDVTIISLILGLGIGRVGCFLNGCDFGQIIQTESDIGRFLGFFGTGTNGILRFPTQLQESFVSFCIFFVGLFLHVKKSQLFSTSIDGVIGLFCGLFSCLNRILNEEFRGDERGVFPGTEVSTSQGIAVFFALLIIVSLIFRLFPRDPSENKSQL